MNETRTRTRIITNDVVTTPGTITIWGNGSCTAAPVVTQVQEYAYTHGTTESENMTDVVTPKFKELSAKGSIVNNPMEKTIVYEKKDPIYRGGTVLSETYGCTPKRWYLSGKTVQDITTTSSYSYLGATPVDEERLKALAVTRSHAKISTAEILSLVSLAESKKSVQTMVNCLSKMNRTLRWFRSKTKLYELKKLRFSDLSDIWLEARYGIRPLVYDIKGVMAALNAELKKRRQTFRGWESDSSYVTDSSNSQWTGNAYTQHYAYSRATTLDVSIRAGVLTSIDRITAFNIAGMDQLPETALELIPFSFIVGWFFNTADYISSWSPNFGIKTLASWVVTEKTMTQIVEETFSLTTKPNTSTMRYTGSVSGGTMLNIRVTKNISRVPNPQLPTIPRVSLNLDWTKAVDLALIAKSLWFRRVGNNSLGQIISRIEAKKRRRSYTHAIQYY